jgi:hypothetical protein
VGILSTDIMGEYYGTRAAGQMEARKSQKRL